jgi:integrase
MTNVSDVANRGVREIPTCSSLLLAAGAPITYVSAQLGHAPPPPTLRYYAKWIPSQGRRWVEVLDRMPSSNLEPKSGTRL